MYNQPKFKLLKVITIAIGVLFTNITFAFDLYSEEPADQMYNSEISKNKPQRENKKSKHHKPTNKHDKHDKHSHKKKSKINHKHNKARHEHRHHGKHKHKKT